MGGWCWSGGARRGSWRSAPTRCTSTWSRRNRGACGSPWSGSASTPPTPSRWWPTRTAGATPTAGGDSPGAKVAVARSVLTASDTALAVTDTSTLNVVAYDAGGQVLAPADGSQTIDHATFTVQPSGSLEISDAHAIALATGPARLTAAVDGFSSPVSFTVAGITHRADITPN